MKNTYYFTYGTDPQFPFKGGWTEVEADSLKEAIILFRQIHPDVHPGIVNCSFMYIKEEFEKTIMYKNGNLGRRCHEVIKGGDNKVSGETKYDFLSEFKSLNEMGKEWFKQEIDSLIEDSKDDISNHELWLKGSRNEEEELMEIENIKNNEDYKDFLTRLRKALGE